MLSRKKLFGTGFLLFFSVGLFINALYQTSHELFLSKLTTEEELPFFIAQINQSQPLHLIPASEPPENCLITAESALIAEISKGGERKILFEKNAEQVMPLASLSKLMAAIVASEFYPEDHLIKVSKRAVEQKEDFGSLKAGEMFKASALIEVMLIESSNDAAFALAEEAGIDGFNFLMNKKGEEMGLKNTGFYNASGLDTMDDKLAEKSNYSTAQDLLKLGEHLLKKPGILEICQEKERAIYLSDGRFHHLAESTNPLLLEMPKIVIAGKTGFTEEAGKCLFIISKGKLAHSYRVNIILNSEERTADMKKLLTCDSFISE